MSVDTKPERKGGIVAVTGIKVPVYEEAGTVLRLKQSLLDLHSGDENEPAASVTTGAGLGGDFLELHFRDRYAAIYGRDLLERWVATFDPDAAQRMPITEFEVNYRPSEERDR